jgi:hypothetical protein
VSRAAKLAAGGAALKSLSATAESGRLSALSWRQKVARVSWLLALRRAYFHKATADPNFTAANRVFGLLFRAFRPFWSGNSNTPDEY